MFLAVACAFVGIREQGWFNCMCAGCRSEAPCAGGGVPRDGHIYHELVDVVPHQPVRGPRLHRRHRVHFLPPVSQRAGVGFRV